LPRQPSIDVLKYVKIKAGIRNIARNIALRQYRSGEKCDGGPPKTQAYARELRRCKGASSEFP
jgi:hypothetical protein